MRKKIPCKVVRSITFGKSDDGLRCPIASNAERTEASSVAYLTYTSRLVVIRTDIDDGFASRTLDLSA